VIPLDRVWQTLQPLLNAKDDDISRIMDDTLDLPRPPELTS
jgi:hypothetical protein